MSWELRPSQSMWDSQPVVIFQLSYNELALKKEANHKETTMAMSKSYKSLYCRRTNIHKASSFVITSCTPLRGHFTLISQNNWKDGMTTCTVQPAKSDLANPRLVVCIDFQGGIVRFQALAFGDGSTDPPLPHHCPPRWPAIGFRHLLCRRPMSKLQRSWLHHSYLPVIAIIGGSYFQDIWIHGNCN